MASGQAQHVGDGNEPRGPGEPLGSELKLPTSGGDPGDLRAPLAPVGRLCLGLFC